MSTNEIISKIEALREWECLTSEPELSMRNRKKNGALSDFRQG